MSHVCHREVFVCRSGGHALVGWWREGEGAGCVFCILGTKAGPPWGLWLAELVGRTRDIVFPSGQM